MILNLIRGIISRDLQATAERGCCPKIRNERTPKEIIVHPPGNVGGEVFFAFEKETKQIELP